MFSFVIRLIFTFVRSWWLLFWFCRVKVNLTPSNHLHHHYSPSLSHDLLPPGSLQFSLIWSCLTLSLQSILKFSSQVSPLKTVMSLSLLCSKLPNTKVLIMAYKILVIWAILFLISSLLVPSSLIPSPAKLTSLLFLNQMESALSLLWWLSSMPGILLRYLRD